MQETQPIRYRPESNLWEIFRYKDVLQVLSDYATFSADQRQMETSPGILDKLDPPRHHQVRSLVSKAFTPRRIEELMPHLIQIADELLDRASASGKTDIAAEFAYLLPIRVIAEMLGLPPSDRERFRQWSYQLFRQFLGTWKPDNSEILQYFSDILNERKLDPQNDLISGLLAAEQNGTHLTHEEIINMCLELLWAGNVTTTVLLTSALYRFCKHPEIYQALRNDPSLIQGAIEETLRYDFSGVSPWRRARHDTVFNGHEIKAGQYVVALIGAANFDETYFPHSDQFDFRRSPNPHLTFSHGVHVCLGSPLARLEGRIALERLVAHFSEIHLDPESPVQYIEDMQPFNAIQSLGILTTQA
jgi:cytochrome P450